MNLPKTLTHFGSQTTKLGEWPSELLAASVDRDDRWAILSEIGRSLPEFGLCPTVAFHLGGFGGLMPVLCFTKNDLIFAWIIGHILHLELTSEYLRVDLYTEDPVQKTMDFLNKNAHQKSDILLSRVFTGF